MTARLHRVRVELWSDYPAAAGARVAFVAADDLVSLRWPRAVDHRAQCTLGIRPTLALVQAVRAQIATGVMPVLRLVPLARDGSESGTDPVTHWRVLTANLVAADPERTYTIVAEHPLQDLGAVGRLRQTTAGGLVSTDLSGIYTPAQALQLAVDWMATQGRGYWTAGAVGRTDPKPLEVIDLTPLALVERIAETWGLTIVTSHAASESQFVVALPLRAGAGGAAPVLRLGDRLLAVELVQDAHDLSGAVVALGADGATVGGRSATAATNAGIAPAYWRVTALPGSGWVHLQHPDNDGGPGPVQFDQQLVGRYCQRPDGVRVQVGDSDVNDSVTSRVQLASTAGLTVGDDVEFRADAAGARLYVLEDPSVPAARRVEVPLPQPHLTGARNYVRDPRGTATPAHVTAGGLELGWALRESTIFPGTYATATHGAPPAGCPVDNGAGSMLFVEFTHAGQTVESPVTVAIDPVTGDEQVGVTIWYRLENTDLWFVPLSSGTPDAGDHSPTAVLTVLDGVNIIAGVPAWFVSDGGRYESQVWLTHTFTVTVDTLRRLRVRLLAIPGELGGGQTDVTSLDGGTLRVWVGAMQLVRGEALQRLVEVAEPCALHRAANVQLLRYHRALETAPRARALDVYSTAPGTYPDQALAPDADVRLVLPEYAIDARARLLSVERGAQPDAVDLSLVSAPDAATAAQLALVAPTRPLPEAELVRRDIAARGLAGGG